jgi:hypothetical protein
MRQGFISRLELWWRSNRGELDACRRELSEALEREEVTSRELSESLERETATSEVLGIISSSPTDLEPVFKAILANATRGRQPVLGAFRLLPGHRIPERETSASRAPPNTRHCRQGSDFVVITGNLTTS